jgi:oligopeptide/dipeptide ABC transporter ATP-binding protein
MTGERVPLAIEGLTVYHHAVDAPVIENLALSVKPGEIRGLVGESGSGKSITCMAALGLLNDDWQLSGQIALAGNRTLQAVAERRGFDAAMIFQDATSSLNPIQTIGQQLTETVARLRRLSRAKARRVALDLLKRVDLPEPEARYDYYPFQLSGGQNQRVMIALALAGQPRILFADEPTTALDVTIQSQILELLKSIRDETGMGIVFVTHDLGVIEDICDTVSVMYSGRIVESGPVTDIIDRPAHPYTSGLISSMPSLAGQIPAGIAGQVPAPGQRPTGCAFAPRCSEARPDCRTEPPRLVAFSAGREVACLNPLGGNQAAEQSRLDHRHCPNKSTRQEPIAEIKNAACDYRVGGGGVFRAVSNVSFDINDRESVAVIGESGSGKSTIGKLLLGVEAPAEGEILFSREPVPLLGTVLHRAYARFVQLVPQNPYLSLDPRATIGNQIREPLIIHRIGTQAEQLHKRDELLEAVGLGPEFADRYPHEISGGQCQRAVIARALCLQPQMLICDEATASLDVSVQARIIALLRELQERFQLSLVFITHDLRIIRSLCQKVAVMQKGELVEFGTAEQVLSTPSHPYTRALLAAVPEKKKELA